MGGPLLDEAATVLLLLAGIGFVVALFVTIVSSVEDCFIDFVWIVLRLKGDPLRTEAAALMAGPAPPERPFAVLLPAWQEAAVLPLSLAHLLGTARYSDFHVFVGCYPNDPETQASVAAAAARDGRVQLVTVPRPGPTCKADCLNATLEAALAWESRQGRLFAGFVLQDAEDIAHGEALACFNRLIGPYDLVQLPVMPMVERKGHLVGGHYLDEFAEMHGKEVPVRNAISGIVPGSGVATAYAREALLAAREANRGEGFSTDSQAEDYDLSFRLARLGTRQLFLRLPAGPGPGLATRRDLIGTREIFPRHFGAAVRQKGRWILGISLQAWRRFGWRGPAPVRYLFLRDRKVLLCGHASLLGHLCLGYLVARDLLADHAPALVPPPLLPEESLLWHLATVNLAFLLYRLLQRHCWVWAVYGWRHLPLVLPRYLVGTLVNYAALWRASLRWARHLRDGAPLGWDKTSHVFPTAKHLGAKEPAATTAGRLPVGDLG